MAETREAVALELFKIIANAEGKGEHGTGAGIRADRKWLLDAYRECLAATSGPPIP